MRREVHLAVDGRGTRDALWGLRFDDNLTVLSGPVFPEEVGRSIAHVDGGTVTTWDACARRLRAAGDEVVVGLHPAHASPLQRPQHQAVQHLPHPYPAREGQNQQLTRRKQLTRELGRLAELEHTLDEMAASTHTAAASPQSRGQPGFVISIEPVPLAELAPEALACPRDGDTLQPTLLEFCSHCRAQADGVGCSACGFSLCWRCTYRR
eukprot:TRINITY_DN9042_c0_g2_i1.p1 TRINITY_DN9042_c0_g2~~TRINITY_DN9042_c0_g2_i1.p1  ORF type:complete len:209 (+),score=33.73 TRINITY_DN9042_c0_g2_i1:98-724(+)